MYLPRAPRPHRARHAFRRQCVGRRRAVARSVGALVPLPPLHDPWCLGHGYDLARWSPLLRLAKLEVEPLRRLAAAERVGVVGEVLLSDDFGHA
eukprot:6078651-Prymnesium_polylepis.1